MAKTIVETRLLVFKDEQNPGRGLWSIRSSSAEVGFTACHKILNAGNQSQDLEVVPLKTIGELNAFCATLLQQGWSTNSGRGELDEEIKSKNNLRKEATKESRQFIWEQHKQDVPQGQYKPIKIAISNFKNSTKLVKYSNDI